MSLNDGEWLCDLLEGLRHGPRYHASCREHCPKCKAPVKPVVSNGGQVLAMRCGVCAWYAKIDSIEEKNDGEIREQDTGERGEVPRGD